MRLTKALHKTVDGLFSFHVCKWAPYFIFKGHSQKWNEFIIGGKSLIAIAHFSVPSALKAYCMLQTVCFGAPYVGCAQVSLLRTGHLSLAYGEGQRANKPVEATLTPAQHQQCAVLSRGYKQVK